jgi:ATP-dependent DNA helicase RecQ
MISEIDRFPELLAVINRHWGFKELRPLQEQAMRAVLERRDSLVVLPTGGGKSLCFQAPALLRANETTVIVSPLIALMKDQVDSLRAAGVGAHHIDSSITDVQRVQTFNALRAGQVRLLFVSPERLAMPNFLQFLQQLGVRTFAIDEAHCISHWGHDFRPEYRQLRTLRRSFPDANFHGYTATATQRVRLDIADQLGLRNPEILVGNFDRPNLCYRVQTRTSMLDQVVEVLKRHVGEAGIIYCIRRKDVDMLASDLQAKGYEAVPYHAGMLPEDRKSAQEAFRAEKCDLVVATVAFGMGIDRSNVRFVLHTGMPKSIEHYQQEAGRAGRDGLEAECILLHGAADFFTWKKILANPTEGNAVDHDYLASAFAHLEEMSGYCQAPSCRHRVLVEHFGQKFESTNCQACDLCLGEVDLEPNSQDIARKILSCVARVKESFGVGHVVAVLRADENDKIIQRGHNKLSTYGLLKENSLAQLRDWTYQLINLGLLDQTDDEYPILKLNPQSWQVMRGDLEAKLRVLAKRSRSKKTRTDEESWDGVDRELFEELRRWRREAAEARGWPPFAVFGDKTLRDLARIRPSSRDALLEVNGIGAAKQDAFGEELLAVIVPWCREKDLTTDQYKASKRDEEPRESSASAEAYFPYFRRGLPLAEVAKLSNRAVSTVIKYLCMFIETERPARVDAWVPADVYRRVLDVAKTLDTPLLRPYFEAMNGEVSYEMIRVVLAHAQHYPDTAAVNS